MTVIGWPLSQPPGSSSSPIERNSCSMPMLWRTREPIPSGASRLIHASIRIR